MSYWLDDFTDMFPLLSIGAIEVDGLVADKVRQVGKNNGLRLEIYLIPAKHTWYVFGVNTKGIRWLFFKTDQLTGDMVTETRKIFWANRNQVKFFKEMRARQREASRQARTKQFEEIAYVGGQYRRVFKGMSRLLGYGGGKVRSPFGAKSVGRF